MTTSHALYGGATPLTDLVLYDLETTVPAVDMIEFGAIVLHRPGIVCFCFFLVCVCVCVCVCTLRD
jgi:hypothetical protein